MYEIDNSQYSARHQGEFPFRFVVMAAKMGSFDCAGSSLRELRAALRMTTSGELWQSSRARNDNNGETMTITAENVVVPSAAPDKRRALGRGLESLLPGGARVASGAAMAPVSTVAPDGARPTVLPDVQAAAGGSRVVQVPLDQIDENPYQTRQYFDSQALQELADSIRANGVVQP